MSLAVGTVLCGAAQAEAKEKIPTSRLTKYRVAEVSRRVSQAVSTEIAGKSVTTLYSKPETAGYFFYNLAPQTRVSASMRRLDNRVLLAQEQTNQPAAAPEDPQQPPALTVPVTPDKGEAPAPNPPADTAGAPAAGTTVPGTTAPSATPDLGTTPGTIVTPGQPTTPDVGALNSIAEAEGRPIAEVRVVGNRIVPSETVLLQATGTRPGAAFSSRQIELDRQKIDALGFFASVQYQVFPNLEDPNRVDVVFTLIENRVVTGFRFEGNTQVKAEDLEKVLETKRGGVLNRNTINTDVERIQSLYRERGFFGLVSESRQLENGNVQYTVREAKISRIDLSGIKKTRESLVRRMIRTKKGDTFDEGKIRQDLNRIYDMGFFEDATFKVGDDPDAPGLVVVTIVLKEKRTGQLSLGAGFDNRSRITGFGSISESNFRGSGRRISASVELGGRRAFELGFGNPFIGEKNASFDFTVFDRTSFREPRAVQKVLGGGDDTASYEERRRGIRTNYTQPLDLDRTKSLLFGFRFENAELFRLDSKGLAGSLPVSSTGTIIAPSIGFLRDKRDLRIDSSRGSRQQLIFEQGFGSSNFSKIDVDLRNYFPLMAAAKPGELPKLVFATRLVGGFAFGQLPAFEQYFVGGPDTVRGYETDVQFGDNQYYGNFELRYRFNRQFQFVGFTDVGSSSGGMFSSKDSGILSSVGIGLRVRTPIGPLRLDLAKALSGEAGGIKTHFAIGPTF